MGCIIPTTIDICDILEKVKLWTIKRLMVPEVGVPVLYRTVVVDMCCYTFVQTLE